MKNKKLKVIMNILIVIIALIGFTIIYNILSSEYKGRKESKEIITSYKKELREENKVESKSRQVDEKSGVLGILEIKKINVNAAIVQGVSDENLKYKVAHFKDTVYPGESGNCVLAAHNNEFGNIFENLNELDNGDIIEINFGGIIYKYKIYEKKIIEPTELSVLEKDKDKEVTLITCSNRAKKRLVVKGILIK